MLAQCSCQYVWNLINADKVRSVIVELANYACIK
jgi:hypothetical protein